MTRSSRLNITSLTWRCGGRATEEVERPRVNERESKPIGHPKVCQLVPPFGHPSALQSTSPFACPPCRWLFVHLYFHPPIHLSTRPAVRQTIHLPIARSFIHFFVLHSLDCPSAHPIVHLPGRPLVRPSVNPSAYTWQAARPSDRPSTYASVCPYNNQPPHHPSAVYLSVRWPTRSADYLPVSVRVDAIPLPCSC